MSTKLEDDLLAESLRTSGLVEPLIWNKRTGTLVSGHRRLKQIDAAEKGLDYSLTVAMIDVDDQEEMALNVKLNNADLTGTFDLAKLAPMFEAISPERMGFTPMSTEMMFDGSGFDVSTMFKKLEPVEAPAVKSALDKLEEINALKRRRKEYKEEAGAADDSRLITHLVWATNEERESFLDRCSLDVNEKFVDGRAVYLALGPVT